MPKIVLKPSPNFNLLPKNPRPLLLQLDDTVVNVEITFEVKAASSAKTDRFEKVAEGVMKEYRDIIVKTVDKVTDKWDGMSLAERKKDAADLMTSVKGAMRALEGAVEKAVRDQLKREAQGDKNLLEARIAVVAKCTFKVIAIGKDVAELAVTGGASLKAWKDLASDIYKLGKLIYDAAKDEPALRADLLKAIGTYCSTKQRRYDEEKKAADFKAKAKLKIKALWTSQKSLADKCEAQRKKYRNEVSAMTQNVDKLGTKRDALQVSLKKEGKLDAKGIQAGKRLVDLGTQVKAMNALILKSQDFTDDMSMLLTEAGIEIDDRTALQKIRALDGLSSIKDAAKEIYATAENIKDLIEALA